MVPGDSYLRFDVRAENTPVEGEFREFSIALDFDAAQPKSGGLSVAVDLGRADMDDEDINTAIAGADWFAVAEFPQAVYTSESTKQLEGGGYGSRGKLTVKGISQPVSFPFTWAESGSSATMTGEFILFRTDFKVGTGEWSGNDPISTDVRLWFELKLEKSE